MAVHVQILRKEENENEATGEIADVVPESGHQNGKIEGFSAPVTNGQNVNGEVTLSRNGSIRGNPLSCSNPVTIPGNPVNSCLQQLRHSEGSEYAGSPRSREGSTPRFHCGSMESDFVLSKAPHSIHSSFDSISMMSSVSMEKLASKVQDTEAPVEVASKSRHHIGHAHHGVDHHAVGHGDHQHGSHWSGRTSPSNSGVGEPRYLKMMITLIVKTSFLGLLSVTYLYCSDMCFQARPSPSLCASLPCTRLAPISLYTSELSSTHHTFPTSTSLSCRNLLVGDARVSHEPFLERGVVGEPSQSQVKIAKTPKQGGSRTSLMFSCEDFYVDSTSVLKDSRHPSHTHLHTPTGGSVTHRLVSIIMIFGKMLISPI